ncbi:hypothetical protein G7Y79_00014g036920 [Physcia stellaris]|nr:hypothetical protein G7Y79_00014g036920 [Physcia stellaris]
MSRWGLFKDHRAASAILRRTCDECPSEHLPAPPPIASYTSIQKPTPSHSSTFTAFSNPSSELLRNSIQEARPTSARSGTSPTSPPITTSHPSDNLPPAKMISDDDLYRLAIFLGCLAMLLIVLYHFLEVNAQDDSPAAPPEKEKGASKPGVEKKHGGGKS